MKRGDLYRCKKCSNMLQVVREGGRDLLCCGEKMIMLNELDKDGAQEKHLPLIEVEGDRLKVSIGSTLHPMQEEHHIEWVELVAGDNYCRKYFTVGEEARRYFTRPKGKFTVRAFCNLHGLWKKEEE